MFSNEHTTLLPHPSDTHARIPASLFAAGDVGYEWDIATDHILWWGAVDAIFGRHVPITGAGLANFMTRQDADRRATVLTEHYQSSVPYDFEFRLTKGGMHRWINDRGRAELSESGRPARLLGVLRVIDRHKAQERRLEERANLDRLTGLINRNRMVECLSEQMAVAGRRRIEACYASIAITKLDIIQEGFGQIAVDAVVMDVARRLRAHLRDDDVVARIGYDEFGILLRDCPSDHLRGVADKLIASLRLEPIATGRASCRSRFRSAVSPCRNVPGRARRYC